jgi:hypothetical protein
MGQDHMLRDRVQELIRSGTFPKWPPDRLWGGPGAGIGCAVCGEPVSQAQVGYEVEFQNALGAAITQCFHVRCYSQLESQMSSIPARPRNGNAAASGQLGEESTA